MEHRRFGSSGLESSALGFGLWPIGGVGTHGYGDVDDQQAIAAIRRALDLGIDLFDTAPAYGNGRGEAILAEALGTHRKETVIVTKCGVPWSEAKQTWVRDGSYEEITSSAENSLRALRSDWIDLLLVHWPDPATPFEEPMRAFADLVDSGKVRYVGVSNFDKEQVAECLELGSLAAQQIGYNILDRRIEAEMLPFCEERGIGVMAYGTLAHGLLTGTFTTETRFSAKDWRAGGNLFGLPLLAPGNFEKNLAIVARLKELAQDAGRSVAQLAVAWVLQQSAVTVALTGARKPEEIEENAKAVDWKLSDSEIEQVDAIVQDAAGIDPVQAY